MSVLVLGEAEVGEHLAMGECIAAVSYTHLSSSSSLPGSSSAPNSSFRRATSWSSLSACGGGDPCPARSS